MAWVFSNINIATLKGKELQGDNLTLSGVTTANITPDHAAQQVNKILDIGGKAIVVDQNMTRTQIEEAEDNG